jgi:hypothetical protein
VILECGGLTPLSSSRPHDRTRERPKKKAVSSYRTPKVVFSRAGKMAE